MPQAQQRQHQPQQQQRFDPEKFQQYMLFTITREAGFTPAEAQAFTPIYKEMREKQRVLSAQVLELKGKKYNSEKDYLNALNKIKCLQVEVTKVEEDYYKRLCKVVSAEKMFKLMKAEDHFHRQMVRGGNNSQNKNPWKARDQKREK